MPNYFDPDFQNTPGSNSGHFSKPPDQGKYDIPKGKYDIPEYTRPEYTRPEYTRPDYSDLSEEGKISASLFNIKSDLEREHYDKALEGLFSARRNTLDNNLISNKSDLIIEIDYLISKSFFRTGNIDGANEYANSMYFQIIEVSDFQKKQYYLATYVTEINDERFRLEVARNSLSTKPENAESLLRAVEDLSKKDELEICSYITSNTPEAFWRQLCNIGNSSSQKLLYHQVIYMIEEGEVDPQKAGTTIMSTFQRIVWKNLCDPNNRINSKWKRDLFSNQEVKISALTSIQIVLYITEQLGITDQILVTALSAMVFKLGLNLYCKRLSEKYSEPSS